MRLITVLVIGSLLVGAMAAARTAVCVLTPTKNAPDVTGTITFTQLKDGENILLGGAISGIPTSGQHGLHIHQWGDISDVEGLKTGGHFNPLNNPHACPINGSTRHMGDMGNIEVDADGNAAINFVLLKGFASLTGPNSLIGRAVVLHSAQDDCYTQPTGNAGIRLAQCVIGISNDEGNEASSGVVGFPTNAGAVLSGPTGATGQFFFYNVFNSKRVRVYGKVTGLSPNSLHGVHVLMSGDLSGIQMQSLLAHYTTVDVAHGLPPSTMRHVGDLGNVVSGNDGSAIFNIEVDMLPLAESVNNIIGRLISVTEDKDDGSTPYGNAGGLVAMGVIGVTNTAPQEVGQASLSPNHKLEGVNARIHPTGLITFTRGIDGNVTIVGTVTGLFPNKQYGVVIHTYGDFNQLAGHFNPTNSKLHGCPPNPERHAGDIGNISADEQGAVSFTKVVDMQSLSGSASIIGRAVAVHANTDSCTPMANGGLGEPIAYGVIGVPAGSVAYQQIVPSEINYASVALFPTLGSSVTGTLYFITTYQAPGSTAIVGTLTGLQPGLHSFHIHEAGDITKDDGLGCGGHFNPYQMPHGAPNTPLHHLGDLGNFTAGNDGTATINAAFQSNLAQEMMPSMFIGNNNVFGRCVIIHKNADDLSQPVGNAGTRLAQGVIGLAMELPIPVEPPYTTSGAVEAEIAPSSSSATVIVVVVLLLGTALVIGFFAARYYRRRQSIVRYSRQKVTDDDDDVVMMMGDGTEMEEAEISDHDRPANTNHMA